MRSIASIQSARLRRRVRDDLAVTRSEAISIAPGTAINSTTPDSAGSPAPFTAISSSHAASAIDHGITPTRMKPTAASDSRNIRITLPGLRIPRRMAKIMASAGMQSRLS